MKPLPLQKAEEFARSVVAELTPFCVFPPEIAGSIRRKRPICNDIDLVIMAKDKAAIRARCLKNGKATLDGELNLIVELNSGVQLDIFFARRSENDLFGESVPCTFGTLFLCRTGSTAFNVWLCDLANHKGLHWNPYQGLFKPDVSHPGKAWQLLACEHEEDIFKALGIDFVKPEDRER